MMYIVPKKSRNYGLERLKINFWTAVRLSMDKAKELGHDPQFVRDDITEGALHCEECGLWAHVCLYLPKNEPNDIGGDLIELVCQTDLFRKVYRERAAQMSAMIPVSSMFAAIGYEPKEVKKDDLIPTRKSRKKSSSWHYNGRRKQS